MTDRRTTELDTFTRALVNTWNHADWPGYRAMTANEYRYEEIASGRRIDNIDIVLADWHRVRAAFSSVGAELVDVVTHGDTSVVSLVWQATHIAPVDTPDGLESPSYKRIRIGDFTTLTWHDRRLATERHQIGFLSIVAAIQASSRSSS